MILLKIKKFELTLFEAVIYFLIILLFFVNPLVWFYEVHGWEWATYWNITERAFMEVGYPQLNFLKSFFLPLLGINIPSRVATNINLNSDFLLTNINLGIGLIALMLTRLMTKRGK